MPFHRHRLATDLRLPLLYRRLSSVSPYCTANWTRILNCGVPRSPNHAAMEAFPTCSVDNPTNSPKACAIRGERRLGGRKIAE